MKICIFTSGVFKLGGTKRVISVIANEMIKEHEVTIVTFEKPKALNRTMYKLDERIHVEFVNGALFKDNKKTPAQWLRSQIKEANNRTGFFNKKNMVGILTNALYPKYIRRKWIDYFNAGDYDFVIATASLSLLLAVISDEIKPKTAGWMHSCYEAYLEQKNVLFWQKNELLKVYLKKLDAVLVLTKYDQEKYRRHLGIECRVMENPKSFVSEEKTDILQKQFFAAARFVEAKGIDLLIHAFKSFSRVNEEWNLVIAGDGPMKKEIRAMIKKYKLKQRIQLIGLTDNVQKYYLESSVYLLTSRWEGWGLVIIEAFEMGLPVIAFDISPINLLISNGLDGIAVEAFDTDRYAAAMVKLAKDVELRKKLSENAIEKSKLFSTEKIYDCWKEMFQQILE